MYLMNYEKDFVKLIDDIKSKPRGKELMKLTGITDDMTDIAQYTNTFFSRNGSNVADLTTDPNSNIKQRSVITYENEAPKGIFRINNYHQMWQRMLDRYGIDRANEAVRADIEGDIYIADFHAWNKPYCYAFSAMDILREGMPFIKQPHSEPAKHLDSFIQHVIQSTMYYSNSIAGAVAFPDLFPAMWFVYQKDKREGYPTSDPVMFERWVEQQMSIFTYTINQPYRSGTQSPFVNISVFDKGFLDDMFSELIWFDPDTDELVEIDLNGVDYLQRKYSEWFVKESEKNLFTFPILTSNMLVDESNGSREVIDHKFLRWTTEITKDRALFNLYTGRAGQLSSCVCSNEVIEVFDEDKQWRTVSMKQLWGEYATDPETEGYSAPKKELVVRGYNKTLGKVVNAFVTNLLRQPYTRLINVELADGHTFTGDELHQVWINGDKVVPLGEVKVGDTVPVVDGDSAAQVEVVEITDDISSDDPYVYDVEIDTTDHLFVHSNGVITHNCCRLRSDSEKMSQFFNSFGSGGVKIGSHRVCTVNLPRLAYLSSDFDDFIVRLIEKMELAHDILRTHRETLQDEIDQGLLPLYNLGLMDLQTQFSTVGIIGFYEALEMLGYDLADDTDNAIPAAQRVVEVMNKVNDDQSFKDGFMYNLEQIPGEAAAIKLAQKDHIVYGDDMKYDMYSNQFIPLVKKVPLATRVKVQGAFDQAMSGGSILHINLAEKVQSVDVLETLMEFAIKNGVVYFAPNYNIMECENGHTNVGKSDHCPECNGEIVENYTRVVGFYTPVSKWKEERRGEIDYESRVFV